MPFSSSPDPIRRRNRAEPAEKHRCTKVRFAERYMALDLLKKIQRGVQHGTQGPQKAPVRAYQCPYCKGWHLTSQ